MTPLDGRTANHGSDELVVVSDPCVEHAPTSGACGPGFNLVEDRGNARESDVHVRVRRRLGRLANLHRQVAQIIENLAEDAQELLDVRADPRLMGVVRETIPNPPAKGPRPLLGVGELAELLRVDEATIRRWRRAGQLPPAIEIASTIRWHPDDVDAWLEDQRKAAS